MLRFAPNTTSDIDIRDLRNALLTYLLAKQKKENFIVRIKDVDKGKDFKDQDILNILDLFEIEYSQVLYQSKNYRFYSAMALQLLHEKKAFSCFCSDEWLEKKRLEAINANIPYLYDDACASLPAELVIDNTNPFTVRIKKILKDEVKFDTQEMDSFIILYQDKTPTNDFACAVDDMLNDISFIIRDEDNINHTSKQEHIRESLGYNKKIEYIYLPSILNNSNESISIKWLLTEGFLPSAIINYILLISYETPEKIFTLDDAIKWFDFLNISKQSVNFDINILRDINKEHLKKLDAKELSRYVGFADKEIGELARIYLEEVSTTKELKNKISPIFAKKEIPKEFLELSSLMIENIKKAPYFETYDEFKNHINSSLKLDNDIFSKLLRYILTGSKNGPKLEIIYKYLKNYIGGIIK